MPGVPEPRYPHFGLRDFLFYFVPGAMVLASIALLAGVTRSALTQMGDIGTSIVAVVAAYIVGQIAYGPAYLCRRLLGAYETWGEADRTFKDAYMWVIEKCPSFYAVEVFRYRNFARFSLAMILPTAFLGVAIGLRMWTVSVPWSVVAFMAGILSAVGYAFRYRRYSSVFRDQVARCWNFDWCKHSQLGSLGNTDKGEEANKRIDWDKGVSDQGN